MAADFSDPRWAIFTPQQNDANRPQFGTRYLTDESAVYTQNAWDHVPPPTDQGNIISAALEKQRKAPVSEEEKEKFNNRPSNYWNNFYKQNDENFFRDRKWLIREFPELMLCSLPEAGSKSIVEIGCGAGNTVFPIISDNKNPELTVHAFDYSAHAVKLVQRNPLYTDPPCGMIHAEVWDLSSPSLPPGVEEGSVDVAVMVFVMSALHPDEWTTALENVYRMLKPGGLACIRDYGRHDLTQLRFKGGRLLEDNFYIRGDKTRVYFFELDELALMFTGTRAPAGAATISTTQDAEGEDGFGTIGAAEGMKVSSPGIDSTSSAGADADSPLVQEAEMPTTLNFASSTSINPSNDSLDVQVAAHALAPQVSPRDVSVLHPNLLALEQGSEVSRYNIEQLHVDRRLLVNRKKQLKMYRVWMQGQFRKV